MFRSLIEGSASERGVLLLELFARLLSFRPNYTSIDDWSYVHCTQAVESL